MIKNNLLIFSMIMLFSGVTCKAMDMAHIERDQIITYQQEVTELIYQLQIAKYTTKDYRTAEQKKAELIDKKNEIKEYMAACSYAGSVQHALTLINMAENELRASMPTPKREARLRSRAVLQFMENGSQDVATVQDVVNVQPAPIFQPLQVVVTAPVVHNSSIATYCYVASAACQ